MKVGDLVEKKVISSDFNTGALYRAALEESESCGLGFIIKIDSDFYGARQAFKIYNAERGHCLHPKMVNGIGPTRDGIRDRVLVLWPDGRWEYIDSKNLEVISEF